MKAHDELDPRDLEIPEGPPPAPIQGPLVLAFLGLLALLFITQGLAIHNSGNLSRTIATYAEGEASIRRLGVALLEIHNAVQLEQAWLVSGDTEAFDPFQFASRVRAAEEVLGEVRNAPEAYASTHEAVGAALVDLQTRHQSILQAVSEGRLDAARRLGSDRRAVDEAFRILGADLIESRHRSERLQAEAVTQGRALDRSLAVIIVSMIGAAVLLAYLWKRILELH